MRVTTQPFTFRPPVRRQGLRRTIGGFLSVLTIGAAAVGVGLLWLQRTMVYEVRGDRLTLTRGLAAAPSIENIPIDTVTWAKPVRLERGKRTMGTSLPGYCAGSFTFPKLGKVELVTNCTREAIVIDVSGRDRSLVLTPADQQSFLSALAGVGHYREDLQPGDHSPASRGLRLLMLLCVLPTLLVPILFFVSPARLRYHITPSTVEVMTTIVTKRFTVSNCIARVYRPEDSSKVLGSSMPGYYSGRFTVDGMATRVYATDLRDGVLIEGPDLRLYLSPEDPHAFLEALRARVGVPIE